MIEIFFVKKTVDFLYHAKYILIIALFLICCSFISFFMKGMNWGLDFTGGYVVEVNFLQVIAPDDLRQALEHQGIENAIVQQFGSAKDMIVRVPPITENKDLKSKIMQATYELNIEGKINRVEFVGPQIGQQMTEQGGLAVLISIVCILFYVGVRFEYRLALGAVLALIHDVILTMGIFSFFYIEFDLTVMAAVLAVVGYSLNDTIVVFDRVRENFIKLRDVSPYDIINQSVTQTMSRTIITTGTTLIVIISLFLLGGQVIHGFATALLCGIVAGTISSIYIASFTALKLGLEKNHMMPVEVEKEGLNDSDIMGL